MKPKQGDVSSSQSCSCTSCTYKSESDRRLFRKISARGSRVDKLYLGKYIPLRERKLLGKLVRTRAVYDDIRTQLLSESSTSISEKADLTPRNISPVARKGKEIDDDVRSSAILELVNLVDKGAALGSRRLSDCCSCCSCGSTIPLHEHEDRAHRHGRQRISSRSSMISRHRAKDIERRKGKHLRHKAKHISSDPCTCTSKLSGLIKRESKALMKKLQGKKPEPVFEPPFEAFEETLMRSGRTFKGNKAKQAGMGETMRNSLTKVRQSKTRIAKKFKSSTIKSIEAIKNAEQKIKAKIEDNFKNKYHEMTPVLKQEEILSDDEIVFNTIRDSVTKYREDMEKKSLSKDWECDFVCDPEECEPEECFRIITKKRLRKELHKGLRENGDRTEMYQKITTETDNVSDLGVQAKTQEMAATTKNKKITTDNINKISSSTGTNIEIDNNKAKPYENTVKQTKNKNGKVQNKCLCENTGSKTQLKTKSVKSNKSLQQKRSKAFVQSIKKESLDDEPSHKVSVPIKKITSKAFPETDPSVTTKDRQAVRIGSSFSFSVEFYKDKPVMKSSHEERKKVHKVLETKKVNQKRQKSSNTSQNIKKNARSGLALKRCFCTLKIKHPKNKFQQISLAASKSQQTMKMSQSPVLLPYECEPLICIPGKCHPIECEKIILNRGINHSTMTTKDTNYKSRSTPSLTSKSITSGESKNLRTHKTVKSEKVKLRKSKPMDKVKTPRQAVRVSSNFSFNIEFYKDAGSSLYGNLKNTRPLLNTPNKSIKSKRFEHFAHRPSQISSSRKSKYTLTKHNLRRCFCTLKLAKPESKRNKIQSHSKGTLTSGRSLLTIVKPKPEATDRATEKQEAKSQIKYALLPYECEPGICVPGECNPYKCLELMNQRKVKTHTRQSGVDQRKTKSTYSITRKRITHEKIANVQSISSSQKNGNLFPKSKLLPRKMILSSKTPNKQAVRIGSRFSFDIEFYREKSPSTRETSFNQVKQLPKQVNLVAIKRRHSQEHTFKSHQKSSSSPAEKKEEKVLAQSNMKRCFCTLKLHKAARNKNKIILTSTGTETATVKEKMYPRMEMASKSTKMKKVGHIMQKLDPYECEPNFCVPGQCDSYRCLDRIKTRDQVKSKEFGTVTDTSRRKLTSSATKTYKRVKNAKSQSYQNPKQYNLIPSTNNSLVSTDILHNKSSSQAVKIGSNLSFNVEFYKDRPSKNYSSKESGNRRPKILKHSGENYRGKPENQGISQTLENKKSNKSSGIRPILKKCFCTLKLQNNKSIKNSPTLMPVLIQNAISSLYKDELIKLKDLLSKQPEKNGTYSSSFSSTFSSSYTESSHYTVHKDFRSFQRSRINNFGTVVNSKSMITKFKNHNIGVNHYLKSSFYAMNIQVQNKQKMGHKLEPYECEPGICIPGQCNPIECQKLIVKRLMKGASTIASTEKRSQSVSSGTLHSKSKIQQIKAPALIPKVEKEQHGIKYETLPRTHKQVVRVGSSFSFNIEFSKDRTTAQQVFQEIKRNKVQHLSSNTNLKKIESRSTRGSQVLRQHRTSQSVVAMQNSGSNVAPKVKRCFCTLKIQKKGRQNKASDLKLKEKMVNKHDVLKKADVGQNTKKIKSYSLSDLDPNECEPNICIPGECDPRECLERINKRRLRKNNKKFGTDMKPKKKSASSMTSSHEKVSRGKQAHIKQKSIKAVKAPIEKKYTIPSRQVVRIGSSFSFDVEFFKDKSFPTDVNIPTALPVKTRAHKQTISQKVEREKNIKAKSIQDSKPIRHQDSQVELPARHEKSTKTGSFIKRCFCTANLHKQNEKYKKQNAKTSPSFLKKCFCVLKSLTAVKAKSQIAKTNALAKPKPPKAETNAFAQTKKIKEKRQKHDIKILKLDPNECEPGVCVPGKCDPLICKERIRKRNTNINKMSSTEAPDTKTTLTVIQPPRTSKSTASNAHNRSNKSKLHVKRQSKTEKRSKSSERSAVRIGSNFSFSMEFYKEKNSTFENVQKAIKEIKHHRVAATELAKIQSPNAKAKGVDRSILLNNRESQVDHIIKKENKSSDVGPMLKRCFCTLALRKQVVQGKGAKFKKKGKNMQEKGIKIEMATKGTETLIKKIQNPVTYKTKPFILEPYECEPGVCVPGQCNPYECEARIKKRQRRESGTETMKPTSKSATTMKTDSGKKHKYQNIQALHKYKKSTASKQHAPMKKIPMNSKDRGKQAVRIGSNFSFNVEFTKSSTGDIHNFKDSKHEQRTKKRTDTHSQAASSRHQKTQEKKDFHDAYSQILAKKVRSTVTEVAPLLKRCFCTLALKNEKMLKKNVEVIKPINKKVTKLKPIKPTSAPPQVHRVINTEKPKNYLRTLDPHECEPGTCVPGKCVPRQCLKRIQKRMQSKMSNTETARNLRVSTTTSKPELSSAKTTREAGYNLRTDKSRPSQSPSNKQVVRIGSNFSFNVEFFKDTSMSNANSIYLPKPKKIQKKSKQSIQTNSQAVSSYPPKLVHRQLQSHGHKTESKASGVGPLMKRCFCTLKLQKVGKLHSKLPEPVKKKKDNSATAKIITKIEDSRISKDAGSGTKKKRRALEPYECEPNTCIPGKCNPLECYEKIKLRNLNEFGTDTIRLSMKSVSSLTDRKSQLKKKLTPLKKTGGTKSTHDQMKRKPERTSHTDDRNRQSVRLGSSFNFDIEFFKEASQKPINDDNYKKPSMVDTHKKIRTKTIKSTSQGSFRQSKSAHHRAQQAHVVQESVGSGISPLLKRCFCTLTLHNTETNKIACAKGRTPKVSTENKSTSTKKQKEPKLKIPNDLDPNECEPGVCIPGQCNAHECLEKIKKRGIHRQSRTTSTNQQRPKGCTNFGCNGTSKRIQADVPKIIVEQPRFPFIDPKNWQGVKIGSNFSFNFEFYKETVQPHDLDTINAGNGSIHPKTKNKSKRLSIKPSTTGDTKKKHCELQPQKLKTENKASIAGKALKRYFCSCKYQQHKQHENVVTVGRVDKIITMSPFKPRQYYIYQIKQHGNVCPDDFVKIEMKTANTKLNNKHLDLEPNYQTVVNKTENVSKDIKTILPFTPRKFHKDGSNTFFRHNGIAKGAKNYCYSCRPREGQNCYVENEKVSNKIELPCRKISKHIRLTSKEEKMILSRLSTATVLKKIFCMKLFSKRGDTNTKHILYPKCNPNNNNMSIKPNSDVLKKSESDRCPEKCPHHQPKKSKSLKTTVITSQNVGYIDQRNKCYSRLQSGDAKTSQKAPYSEKNVVWHCKKCITDEQIVKVNYYRPVRDEEKNEKAIKCKTAVLNLQHDNTSKDPNNILMKNVKSLGIPTKPGNIGILFECGRKLSKCKEKMISHFPQITHSGYRKSCCFCKNKYTNKILRHKVIVEYNEQLKGHVSDVKESIINKKGANLTETIKKSLRKPGDGSKTKANRQKFSKEHVCFCDTTCACAKYKKNLNNKMEISQQEKLLKEKSKEKTKKQLQKNNIKKPLHKLAQHRKLYRKDNAVRRQPKKKISIKITNDQIKYQGTGDCVLLAESVIDIAKLSTTVDMLRSTKGKLEEWPATNYLIHKYNPKKKKKNREPSKFSYNLYMDSLRKKPWLPIYYSCPWFYPHWLSMLNVWKQFTDVVLFLLAVVVWSPCIFLVEGCRAAMCCTCMS